MSTDCLDLGEPALEAQVAHAATFESLRLEVSLPLVMSPSLPRNAQPVCGAQIEGEDGRGHGVSPYPVRI
jgi:hypothetical protein